MHEGQKIVGFSGKKGSGKNTSANFILGMVMHGLAIVQEKCMPTEKGGLWISDIFGQKEHEGEFDYFRVNDDVANFKAEHLDPYISIVSFADLLKQSVCIDILGLTHEQCYGTDEQKNTLTQYRWENMPGVVTTKLEDETSHFDKLGELEDVSGRLGYYYSIIKSTGLIYHEPGKMAAREVMQYVGSDIFRKIFPNVWVEASLRQVKKKDSEWVVFTDVRFPNEVEGIQKVGGKVIRLTRNPNPDDTHMSETSLDPDRFDWNNFDYILKNEDVDIRQQWVMTAKILEDFEFISAKEKGE